MSGVAGRNAIILVSTGMDTFSKTTFDQLLQEVRAAGIPIYVISLSSMVSREVGVMGPAAPFARIDWTTAEKRLEMLAQTSGGRAYSLQSAVELPAVFDDIMENLRIRYVITYTSSNPSAEGPPRSIRVDLVDPKNWSAPEDSRCRWQGRSRACFRAADLRTQNVFDQIKARDSRAII